MLNPLASVIASFCFLGVMLYKRVNLGVALNATAVMLALLAVDWLSIPNIAYETVNPLKTDGLLAISAIVATFMITWFSHLFKDTGVCSRLSESLSRLVKNPKAVLSIFPAIIGLLPVPGGALMSAPIVDSEGEKLKLNADKKAYVNLWFRHTIFPVYPLGPTLIITLALTGMPMPAIILLQIPTVIIMVVVGYFVSFWNVPSLKRDEHEEKVGSTSEFKNLFVAFSPILATIVVAVFVSLFKYELSQKGLDVLIATFVGLMVLAAISRLSLKTLLQPLKEFGIYGVALAVYGALLLRNVMKAAGISEVFQPLVLNGNIDLIVLLTVIPAALAFLTGSPAGAVAISTSILTGILTFSPKPVALLYMSAYLGYVIAPTHLCFTFTAEYFKSSLGKVYKYMIPSFTAAFLTALIVYLAPYHF